MNKNNKIKAAINMNVVGPEFGKGHHVALLY